MTEQERKETIAQIERDMKVATDSYRADMDNWGQQLNDLRTKQITEPYDDIVADHKIMLDALRWIRANADKPANEFARIILSEVRADHDGQ